MVWEREHSAGGSYRGAADGENARASLQKTSRRKLGRVDTFRQIGAHAPVTDGAEADQSHAAVAGFDAALDQSMVFERREPAQAGRSRSARCEDRTGRADTLAAHQGDEQVEQDVPRRLAEKVRRKMVGAAAAGAVDALRYSRQRLVGQVAATGRFVSGGREPSLDLGDALREAVRLSMARMMTCATSSA